MGDPEELLPDQVDSADWDRPRGLTQQKAATCVYGKEAYAGYQVYASPAHAGFGFCHVNTQGKALSEGCTVESLGIFLLSFWHEACNSIESKMVKTLLPHAWNAHGPTWVGSCSKKLECPFLPSLSSCSLLSMRHSRLLQLLVRIKQGGSTEKRQKCPFFPVLPTESLASH